MLCHSGAAPSGLQLGETALLVNYVYLDSEERKRFAQASHEYLIEQLQFTGSETVNQKNSRIRLNFNHPCKEIVWNLHLNKWTDGKSFLAWVPNDSAALRDLATRRFVTMCANVQAGGVHVASALNSSVQSNAWVTGALLNTFNSLQAQVIGPITTAGSVNYVAGATYNDVTYEVPLSWSVISTPVSTLLGTNHNTGSAYSAPVVVNDWFNYSFQLNKEGNPMTQALLQLNGMDRFEAQDGNYFNYVQPWEAHSATPSDGVNVYSFALNPEDHQPSGTCNFSRIDNATLNLTYDEEHVNADKDGLLNVYAVNYNVLTLGRNRYILKNISNLNKKSLDFLSHFVRLTLSACFLIKKHKKAKLFWQTLFA